MPASKFKDRVAIVTGASTGIGASTAIQMAQNGVKTVINYYRSEDKAREVLKKIESSGGTAVLVQADVRDNGQVKNMVQKTIDKFGKIDILINNAGGLIKRVAIAETDDSLWDATMDLNLRSMFYCCRATIPHMIKNNYGRIVNISSLAADNGGGKLATIYATAKSGMYGFTKGLAKELGPNGITVNAISPGLIVTPFHTKAETGNLESMVPMIPVKRLGTADEVASLTLYLSSDDAGFVTGSIYRITGGQR
jgi:3-oxoacyl-[acyl-carrier protein] reductase